MVRFRKTYPPQSDFLAAETAPFTVSDGVACFIHDDFGYNLGSHNTNEKTLHLTCILIV